MSPRTRTLLAQAGSFVLAGVLLYLALRGTDLSEIGRALKSADYRWLLPLTALVLLSHWIRAWRWKLLLEALPPLPTETGPRHIPVRAAFYSVMIGYMVNYAAPRLGEVARTANISTRERLPFGSVLGTVVVERILDIVTLAFALGSVALLLMDRAATLDRLFFAPLRSMLGRVPLLAVAGLTVAVAVLVFLIYRRIITRGVEGQRPFVDRFRPVLVSFRDGIFSVLRSRRRVALVVSTFGMWVCYGLMAHLPFEILRMTEPYGISLIDSWCIMVLGTLGIVVPSPGGTGSYHLITSLTLTNLYGISGVHADTYAVLTHGAQLILYVVTGFICMLLQGTNLQTLRPPVTEAAPETEQPVATPERI